MVNIREYQRVNTEFIESQSRCVPQLYYTGQEWCICSYKYFYAQTQEAVILNILNVLIIKGMIPDEEQFIWTYVHKSLHFWLPKLMKQIVLNSICSLS